MTDRVKLIIDSIAPPFALLYRPGTAPDRVDLLRGDVVTVSRLADLPVPAGRPGHGPRSDLLALVPYRQIAERGFACPDDGTPLRALRVDRHERLPLAEVLAALPTVPTALRSVRFDLDDERYAALVRRVVTEEIGRGAGANFVLKRSLLATIEDYHHRHAQAVFGRLVRAEPSAHWVFLVHTGDRTLVGASPERHVTVAGGAVEMNPISGTLRYPPGGPGLTEVLAFLSDRKESDELYMVLDEELKMMGRVCRNGGRVIGPRLRTMARLAHTEYFIQGHSDRDLREILYETMFAPTVVGSPLESACRVIRDYEPGGRGYYSGVLALIGRDAAGRPTMDSGIVIRTADIDASGAVRLDVGATLVRHSDPLSEAAETRAKADALRLALDPGGTRAGASDPDPVGAGPWAHPDVARALAARNDGLARFWLAPTTGGGHRIGTQRPEPPQRPTWPGRTALVVDCEDHFTAMLGHLLRSLGLRVTIRRVDEPLPVADADLLVMGPGPGDPTDLRDPRIARMRQVISRALAERRPMLAVCLSHQVLCQLLLGLPIVRLDTPNQGAQREIQLFGQRRLCGFYNTFTARADADVIPVPGSAHRVEVARDPATGDVHALRGDRLRSLQFHPESVLTTQGIDILCDIVADLIGPAAAGEEELRSTRDRRSNADPAGRPAGTAVR